MNNFDTDYDKSIEAIKNNKTTYFIDYNLGRKDIAHIVPKWIRHPNATIDDVLKTVRQTHFYPISNLNIREEKNLDELFNEDITHREYYFGKRYQEIHEQMYEDANIDYAEIKAKAKENYFHGLEIKNQLYGAKVINE